MNIYVYNEGNLIAEFNSNHHPIPRNGEVIEIKGLKYFVFEVKYKTKDRYPMINSITEIEINTNC